MATNPMLLAMAAKHALEAPIDAAARVAATGAVPPSTLPTEPAFPVPVPRPGGAPTTSPIPVPRPETVPSEAETKQAPSINPFEGLVPPIINPSGQIPQAGRPGLGGQLNPQFMQFIMQSLAGGQQPQVPAQSLGQILGQIR